MKKLITKTAVGIASGALFLSLFAPAVFAGSTVSISGNGSTTIVSGNSTSNVSITNTGNTNSFSSGKCAGRTLSISITNGTTSWR